MHAGTLLGKLQQRSCRVAVVVCHELVCAEDEQPKHNGGVLDGNGNVQRGIARLRLRVDFSTCPQQVADEVIAAADEAGLAMVFTGMRHFRH